MRQPSLFPEAGRFRLGSGPLHLERLLLDDLGAALDGDPSRLLARPVVVVVPSRGLRLHLLARLVALRGRAVAGLTCTTHFGLAASLLLAAEGRPVRLSELSRILVRRLGRREPVLRRALGHLTDGFAPLTVTVRDLLEAGLEPAHREALEEALVEEGRGVASAGEIERARAVVRTAAASLEELEGLGLERPSTILSRAAGVVRGGGPPGFRPSGVFVYGFTDATGVVTDLLEALIDRHEGLLYLDQPPDPGKPDRPDPGIVFGRRFRERLTARSEQVGGGAATSPPARPELFRALGGEAEVREVARRVAALIASGTAAERIGVVARDLRPYALALRTQFGRLGIPFSGIGALGPPGATGRRVRALVDLLGASVEAPFERWLDARYPDPAAASPSDLLIAFFAMGAGRLGEVARLDLERILAGRSGYPLPLRQGFEVLDDDGGAGGVRLRKRRVAAEALRQAAAAAAATAARLERWQAAERLDEHRAQLEALLADELGWPSGDAAGAEVAERLAEALAGVPERFAISYDEFVLLLRELLATAGCAPLGGAGGGARVLDVIEARGLTFDHLFVLGLNRGVFPRVIREDPLLPDSLRAVLGREGHGVLPDLALKRSGADEERLLFAQLLAAAPKVTLSWQEVDDDNHALARSPLVERLRWSLEGAGDPPTARHALGADLPADPDVPAPPRPAFEHLVESGLRGRHGLTGVLAAALAESREASAGGPEVEQVAAARLRILAELDPALDSDRGRATRAAASPYFGFVGPPRDPADPRRDARIYVTTLERLCGCPWQAFLERVLRLEPAPDPLDALPFATPLMIGDLVHRVAERLVERELVETPATLAEAVAAQPVAVPWPDDADLDALTLELARRVARDQGVSVPGFPRLLRAIVKPYLARLQKLDWPKDRPLQALAAELTASVDVPAGGEARHELWFKIDRLDRGSRGLRLTDYKSGRRVVSRVKTEKRRRQHLIAAIERGERLQAPAYALAAGGPADEGRYLFVHPEIDAPPEALTAAVRGRDREALAAFASTAAAALTAWEQGAFFPRLVLPDQDREPNRCKFCAVAEACLRGDSGARGRLRGWAAGPALADPSPAAGALGGVWRLGTRERR